MIPDSFFEEEIRNDFKVTKKRKKIWAVEIGLLQEFDRVCKENNIKYMVAYGTVLGAVRHKGFIPWDDDIDVVLFREDYDKLMKIGDKEFKGKFFFQSYKTEDNYYRNHAQLRNSETTAILKTEVEAEKAYNKGIFIDIFPLDGYPNDDNKAAKLKKKLLKIRKTITDYAGYNYYGHHSWLGKIKHMLVRIINIKTIMRHYDKVCSKYSNNNEEYVCDISYMLNKKVHIWEKERIEETQEYTFEYTSVIGPKEYEYYLKTLYGEYNVFVKDGNLHGDVLFNPDKPYTYYYNEGRKELEEYATTEH